jgi:hypothetical protein
MRFALWLRRGRRRSPLPGNAFLTPTGWTSSQAVPDLSKEGEFGRFTGRCPDCGSEQWRESPQGGITINIQCGGCGLWLNYCPPLGLAERIGRKDLST